MTTRSRLKRALGVMGAGALALMLGISGTVSAHAAEGDVNPTLDNSKTGSIIIHKKLNPTTPGGAATGEEMQNVSGEPLDGVEFTVEQLTQYDLTKTATWQTLANLAEGKSIQNLTVANIPEGATKGTAQKKTTVDGEASFTNLPLGLYLVTESDTSGAQDAAGNAVAGIVPSAPFLVFVPTTAVDGKSWIYDVHVYPKNTANTVTKEVLDADKNVGDTITYKIDADVPRVVQANEKLTKYEIQDNLPEGTKVTFNRTNWPSSASLRLVSADEAALDITFGNVSTLGTVIPAGNFNITYNGDNNTLTAAATADGLTWLSQQAAGSKIRFIIQAKLLAVNAGNGIIENDAQLITRYPNTDQDTTVKTNKVKTYLGKVTIKKIDDSDEERTLSGAKFELYRIAAEDETGAPISLKGKRYPGVIKVTINGVNSWTTGSDGTVLIDGLHVTDIENDADFIENRYFLKEIEAPAGYVLPTGEAAWTDFELISSDSVNVTVGGATVQQISLGVSVPNTRSDVPNLPLTGGKGIALIVVLGVAVAGAAIFSARRNSRKA